MEPQVTICCGKRNQKCCCLYRILYVIIGLFAFVVGILLGTTGIVELLGAVYFFAIATVLVILAIITFIYIWCSCRN